MDAEIFAPYFSVCQTNCESGAGELFASQAMKAGHTVHVMMFDGSKIRAPPGSIFTLFEPAVLKGVWESFMKHVSSQLGRQTLNLDRQKSSICRDYFQADDAAMIFTVCDFEHEDLVDIGAPTVNVLGATAYTCQVFINKAVRRTGPHSRVFDSQLYLFSQRRDCWFQAQVAVKEMGIWINWKALQQDPEFQLPHSNEGFTYAGTGSRILAETGRAAILRLYSASEG